MTYDDYILRGPPETDLCAECLGDGEKTCPECEGKTYDDQYLMCFECGNRGVVPCLHEEEEPDGDYLYERMRDRKMEDEL